MPTGLFFLRERHNRRKSACDDNVRMRVISVEQVFAAVTDLLAAQGYDRTVMSRLAFLSGEAAASSASIHAPL